MAHLGAEGVDGFGGFDPVVFHFLAQIPHVLSRVASEGGEFAAEMGYGVVEVSLGGELLGLAFGRRGCFFCGGHGGILARGFDGGEGEGSGVGGGCCRRGEGRGWVPAGARTGWGRGEGLVWGLVSTGDPSAALPSATRGFAQDKLDRLAGGNGFGGGTMPMGRGMGMGSCMGEDTGGGKDRGWFETSPYGLRVSRMREGEGARRREDKRGMGLASAGDAVGGGYRRWVPASARTGGGRWVWRRRGTLPMGGGREGFRPGRGHGRGRGKGTGAHKGRPYGGWEERDGFRQARGHGGGGRIGGGGGKLDSGLRRNDGQGITRLTRFDSRPGINLCLR